MGTMNTIFNFLEDHLASAGAPGMVFDAPLRLLRISRVWRERCRQRQHLVSLDDHHLDDIGVTRAQAQREYRKPFWRR